ncbi:hypothetical protein [Neptuniibacter sp. 2_MG-2023]|jgi:hypothetical protein|uniref:hypothetical protein n=1 Tax=Neptuniibacter sp. 2_MG-2023 TaxID=3062671 RepID=UPI0026E2417A|nr:hypothetical protein [Neptuniibacter sp. 2_MG-2023]MDO6513715.1 hypothetical protein [Neptuniibacter sp. 2_MG-2023]
MSQRTLWGKLRLTILILVLLVVALNAWLSRVRSTDWQESLWVVIYPINSDQRADTQQFINGLSDKDFDDIEQFVSREAKRYGIVLDQPVEVYLAPPLPKDPPKPPEQSSILESVIWSLHLRYWAWNNNSWQGPSADVQVYLRLFSPRNHQVLEHSLGLQKGMVGVVNGFASKDYQRQNDFIIVHELLHTLGATDKYDLHNNQPIWPEGYADPNLSPLLPQLQAEVMGGRIPVEKRFSVIPSSLEDVVVGDETAKEINWIK